MLDADTLLAGSAVVVAVEIPERLLGAEAGTDSQVRIKPLSVHDLRLIQRASRENDELIAALMVQRALVEPVLNLQQVSSLSAGLLQFLLQQINRVSGIQASDAELSAAAEDPITQASFELAQAFGWTPEQISELTLGQVMLHLQMLRAQSESQTAPNQINEYSEH